MEKEWKSVCEGESEGESEGERDRTAQAILCVCNVCAYVCSTELQTGKVRGELPIQSL